MPSAPPIRRFVELDDVVAAGLEQGQSVLLGPDGLEAFTPVTILDELTAFETTIEAGNTFRLKNSVLVEQSGHPSSAIEPGSVVFEADEYGNFLLGVHPLLTSRQGNVMANGHMPTGLFYQEESHYLYVGGIDIPSVGNPANAIFSRSGPASGWPYSTPTGVLSGNTLGVLRFRGMTTPQGGTPGVTTGGIFEGDSAAIYAKASENNLDNGDGSYSQGGELYFAPTPNGTFTPVPSLILKNDGDAWFEGGTFRFIDVAGQIMADSATLATNPFLQTRIATDAESRFVLRQSGAMEWGDGTDLTDVFLARPSAGELALAGSLSVSGALAASVGGDFAGALPSPTLKPGHGPHSEIELAAYGLITWSDDPSAAGNAQGTPTEKIMFRQLPVKAGDVITNIWLAVAIAAVGPTLPTSITIAILDHTLTNLLGITANLKSDSKWLSQGWKPFALGTPYEVLADGFLAVAFLKDGVFSGTDLSIGRGIGGFNGGALNGIFPYGNGGTSKTAITGGLTPTVDATTFWCGAN